MYTKSNDYGCTKYNGVSDMTETNGTLLDQINKAGIRYTRTSLNMGTTAGEKAYLLHYTSPKTQQAVTVLVVPDAGIDSWAESYYHFPGMTIKDAISLDWFKVYEHVHKVWWENVKKNIPHPTPCPNCGKMDINKDDTYRDIRGRTRCSYCHNVRS